MDVRTVNSLLSQGKITEPGLFPHYEQLSKQQFIFEFNFGLDKLPEQPGIIIIRGPRQYGKSTWIETQLKASIEDFGSGSAYYLNGDLILEKDLLIEEIRDLCNLFDTNVSQKRIFIDEITAIKDWQLALKILADNAELKDILVITTGSKARDLLRGEERLPGRKGKLVRSEFIFTPVSYQDFSSKCSHLGNKSLKTYLISGGSPLACSELATQGKIPAYVLDLIKDWIFGEASLNRRSRSSLNRVLIELLAYGGNTLSQSQIAREAGLANNTIAAEYLELLKDLLIIRPSYRWESHKQKINFKKQAKYHFTNLLVASVWKGVSSIEDFDKLSSKDRGMWWEWLFAQEILRRAAISNKWHDELAFWQSKEHEIDFVIDNKIFLEIKSGQADPRDFTWFDKSFPSQKITVSTTGNELNTKIMNIKTIENLLLSDNWNLTQNLL